MHDIVLEISFLDINSQNWITGSHLKLLLKSLKIQYIFQKFLCMADGPQKTDFWIPKIFLFQPFFDLFSHMMDQKMAGAKKVVNTKNHFFHAGHPRQGIFDVCSP